MADRDMKMEFAGKKEMIDFKFMTMSVGARRSMILSFERGKLLKSRCLGESSQHSFGHKTFSLTKTIKMAKKASAAPAKKRMMRKAAKKSMKKRMMRRRK